jgi:hypothetical protein
MEYTEADHAKALIKMLESGDVCKSCPPRDFGDSEVREFMQKTCQEIGGEWRILFDICSICCEFIAIPIYASTCPCEELGRKEAIKRVWLALEEGGYI